MEKTEILEALLELVRDAGLEIRSVGARANREWGGELPPASAVCRVKDAVWVVLSAADPPEAQISVLAQALSEHAGDRGTPRALQPVARAAVAADQLSNHPLLEERCELGRLDPELGRQHLLAVLAMERGARERHLALGEARREAE